MSIGSKVIILFLFPLILWFGSYLLLLSDDRYTMGEMDLDKSGLVSYREALTFMDSGVREIVVAGEKCIEYYAYKDGMPFKTVCNRS